MDTQTAMNTPGQLFPDEATEMVATLANAC